MVYLIRVIFLVSVIAMMAFASISAQAQVGWVPSGQGSPLPAGALAGGSERGTPLYVCRAPYKGGLHPGKVVGGRCNITYGGEEVRLDDYQVLVGEGYWAKRGATGAYVAGMEGGRGLYLCRAHYIEPDSGRDLGVHPGKVVAGRCNIGYGGREVRIEDFEYFYQNGPVNPANNPANGADVSGNFEDAWIEHNVIENGRKGMRVHVRFIVRNGNGVPSRLIAYFYYEEGKPLRSADSQYRTADGMVSAHESFTPRYDTATFDNFQLFVPYDALNMGPGKSRLKFNIELYDENQRKFFAKSVFYHFVYTRGPSVAANTNLLTGAWKLVVTSPNGETTSATLIIRQDGSALTGFFQSTGGSTRIPDIILTDRSFSAAFEDTTNNGQQTSGNISGHVDGNQMVGTINFLSPLKITLNFVGTRTGS